jgi:hypothetical protein
MKTLLILISVLLVISCDIQKSEEAKREDMETVDIINTDTGDTLFMLFFENFMWNKEFQKSRIVFPFRQDDNYISNSKNWKHLSFYAESKYIPVLNSDTITLSEKDVETTTVGMFIVNFKSKTVTNYSFTKNENKWFLVSSASQSMESVPDNEFIYFLTKFSEDSVFQISHIVFPLPESYTDPEKDYETAETTLLQAEWRHLELVDFENNLLLLSNIDTNHKYRILYYRGVENGINVKFTFERIDGSWELIKLEDYST